MLTVRYGTKAPPVFEGIAFSRNLSSVGVNIVMPHQLIKGTGLELNIHLPGTDETVFAKGKVVWQAECSYVPQSGKKYYSTGIQFYYMSTDDAIKSSDCVRDILKKNSDEQTRAIIDLLEKETTR